MRLDSHLDDVGKVFPLDMVVSLDEDLPQDGLTDGVVLGVELIKAVECVPVLKGMRTVKPQPCAAQAPPPPHGRSPLLQPYRVHVQSVYAQVEGRQVHALKHLLEGLASAVLDVDDLPGVFLHRSLDESQQVLLIHAGRRMYVCVHLE